MSSKERKRVNAAEEPSGLLAGDLVYASSLRLKGELMPGTFVETTVKANKGTVLAVLLLAEVPLSDKVGFDIVKAMDAMGWQLKPGRGV